MANSKKVLIIEDEGTMSRVLSLKLEKQGYEVDIANDGKEGIEHVSKNKYNCIVLDLMMPNVDGFEVLKTIRSKDKKIKVIVVSNLSQEEDVERAKGLGATEYFAKVDTSLSAIVEFINKNI